ncbi:MAG: hypothetical protein R3B72_22290 [Polyangiaceae bacterium]
MRVALALMFFGAVGCNGLFGVDDLRYDGSTGPAASSGSASGAGGVAVGSGGAGGAAGDGGWGGSGGDGPPTLVDRGLLLRYDFAEQPSGKPSTVVDHAPDPFTLPAFDADQAGYVELATGRGLDFTTADPNARLLAAVPAKLTTPTTEATLEVVVSLTQSGANGVRPRIFHVGPSNDTSAFLSLIFDHDTGGFASDVMNTSSSDSGHWLVGGALTERRILHLVLDSAADDPDLRLRLFAEGVEVVGGAGSTQVQPVQQGLSLALSGEVVVANWWSLSYALPGTLYYLAYYGVALSPSELAENTAVLQQSDDLTTP